MRLLVLGAALMLLAACLGRVPAVSYYRLVGPQGCSPLRTYPYKIAVVPFGASPALRQTSLLYRPSPYELATYDSSRWEAMPSEMVTERLQEFLEDCRLFNGVTRYGLSAEPQLLLRGRLVGFEEVNGPQGAQAELSVEAELVSLDDSETLWEGRLVARTPMVERSPRELARAMSKSLAAVLEEMTARLAPALERFAEARSGAGGR
jgi:ABC-type uncharacterized transport system auxiliary subunit